MQPGTLRLLSSFMPNVGEMSPRLRSMIRSSPSQRLHNHAKAAWGIIQALIPNGVTSVSDMHAAMARIVELCDKLEGVVWTWGKDDEDKTEGAAAEIHDTFVDVNNEYSDDIMKFAGTFLLISVADGVLPPTVASRFIAVWRKGMVIVLEELIDQKMTPIDALLDCGLVTGQDQGDLDAGIDLMEWLAVVLEHEARFDGVDSATVSVASDLARWIMKAAETSKGSLGEVAMVREW